MLVVDDEPQTCELLIEFCRSQGLRAAAARDGRAAIAAVERTPSEFEIVITDLQLPGADGFEVLRAVRRLAPACYVVMITGYATIDAAVRAVREGAYDFLAKPFSLGQLEIVLGRVRDRIALERDYRELSRQIGARARAAADARAAAGAGGPDDVAARLAAIERRLTTIEELLRRERR